MYANAVKDSPIFEQKESVIDSVGNIKINKIQNI